MRSANHQISDWAHPPELILNLVALRILQESYNRHSSISFEFSVVSITYVLHIYAVIFVSVIQRQFQ